jgi:hypothetical protein
MTRPEVGPLIALAFVFDPRNGRAVWFGHADRELSGTRADGRIQRESATAMVTEVHLRAEVISALLLPHPLHLTLGFDSGQSWVMGGFLNFEHSSGIDV